MSRQVLMAAVVVLSLAFVGLLFVVVYQRGRLDAVPPTVRVTMEPPAAPAPSIPVPPTALSPASEPPVSNLQAPVASAQEVFSYLNFLNSIEDKKCRIIAVQTAKSRDFFAKQPAPVYGEAAQDATQDNVQAAGIQADNFQEE